MNSFYGKLLATAIILAALFVPDVAQAFPFKPSDGDKSVQWFLHGIFGELSGGDSDPLRSVLGIFNGAVLCIGGILLFYTLIAGTMQTAHDGEVLGKRWSSLWLPIRTSLGVAAIMPINGGYAVIQYAVIWLAIQGVGIADAMVRPAISGLLGQNNQYTFSAASVKPEITSLVRQMAMNSACVHTFNADIAGNLADTAAALAMGPLRLQAKAGQYMLERYGGTSSTDSGVGYFETYKYGCGSVLFPGQEIGSSAENLRIIDVNALKSLREIMWTTHRDQMLSAMGEANDLGKAIATAAEAGSDEITLRASIDSKIEEIATAWAEAAVQAAMSQSKEIVDQKVINAIENDGWIMLGSWYIQIALTQQNISDTLAILPEVSIPDAIIEGARSQTDGSGGLYNFISGVVRFTTGEKTFIGQDAAASIMYAVRVTDGGGDHALASPGSSSPKGMLASITRKLTSAFSGVDLRGTDKNPVVLASEIGGRLVVSTTVAIGVMTVAAGVAGLSATVGTNIVLVLVSFLSPLLVALLGAGLTLSYYVPMLPYIIWLGAVFGWVVLVVEAVIAAPLWAVTHLAPDGDGVVGRGGQGYMLVLSLTLRPALMVFGFAAAVAVMHPMGLFLNETFMGAFFGSAPAGMTGLLKILAGSIIYAVLLIMIINRVFSLIHQIPDGILRWIGGGDNVIGREASEANSGAGRAIAASTAAAGAAGAISGASQQLGSTARQNRLEKQNRLNSNAATASQDAGNAGDLSSRGISTAQQGASDLSSLEGSSGYENAADRQEQRADAAAISAVQHAQKSANATIANSMRKLDSNDPSKPSASDVAAARDILSSIKSSGALQDGDAARGWLNGAAQKHANTKFGSQLTTASTDVSDVHGKLQSSRANHNALLDGKRGDAAVSAVGDIERSATDTIYRAGFMSGDDPDYPTQDQISDAQNVLDSIASSRATESSDAATSWLGQNDGKYGGSLGDSISRAARASSGSGSGSSADGIRG